MVNWLWSPKCNDFKPKICKLNIGKDNLRADRSICIDLKLYDAFWLTLNEIFEENGNLINCLSLDNWYTFESTKRSGFFVSGRECVVTWTMPLSAMRFIIENTVEECFVEAKRKKKFDFIGVFIR